MSKYDWSNVPKEVEWICTDEGGKVFGFTCFPNKKYSNCFSCGKDGKTYFLINANQYTGAWEDSLEKRP